MPNGDGPASGLVFEDFFTGHEMHFLPPSGPTPKDLAGSATLSFASAGRIEVLHGVQYLQASAGLTFGASADADAAWSLGGTAALHLEAADTSGILKGTGSLGLEGTAACRAGWALRGSGNMVLEGSVAAALLRRLGGIAALSCGEQAILKRNRSVEGATELLCLPNAPRLVRFWIPFLSVPAGQPDRRRLTWATDEAVEVWIDGQHHATVEGDEMIALEDLEIRQMLDVWDEPPMHVPTPNDRVALSWAGDAVAYQVWRRKDGGAWDMIDQTELPNTWTDRFGTGPTTTGSWASTRRATPPSPRCGAWS